MRKNEHFPPGVPKNERGGTLLLMRIFLQLATGSLCLALSFGCKDDPSDSGGDTSASPNTSASGGTVSGDASSEGGNVSNDDSGTESGDSTGQDSVPTKTLVFFGMGEWGGSGAIDGYLVDEETLALSEVSSLEVGTLNSFAAFHPEKPIIYVGDESEKKLRSYSIDPTTGKLTFLNDITTKGGPVYVSVDSTGQALLSAYYNEGSVEAFELASDGGLASSKSDLSTGTQAHAIVLSPDETFAFVPHKGDDNVMKLRFSAETANLEKGTPESVERSGGPRHLTFHPSGEFAYVVNELAATVTAFSYQAQDGVLDALGTYDAFEEGADKSGADIHVTPDGRYLYASNRSANDSTLAVFSVESDGTLTHQTFVDTRGSTPRNFAIHPSGDYLIVANQESNNVVTFRIQEDGSLEFVETTDTNGSVAWVGFLPRAAF